MAAFASIPHDPVPAGYARDYAQSCYGQLEEANTEIDEILGRVGSVQGFRVLDLGGGPGQYSALFAQSGAFVTWHDVSTAYERLASDWCIAQSVQVEFEIGAMEDLARYPRGAFDLVFNRLCWYYARNERALYAQITRILKPGGYFVLRTHNAKQIRRQKNLLVRWIYYALFGLHEITGIKLAHVPASSRRLRKWFFDSGEYQLVWFEESDRNIRLTGKRLG